MFILDQVGPQSRDNFSRRGKHKGAQEEVVHGKTEAGIGLMESQTPRMTGATGSRKKQGLLEPPEAGRSEDAESLLEPTEGI